MGTTKLIGLLLIAGGITCMVLAYKQSDTAVAQVNQFFTGVQRDRTVWVGIVGIVATLLGLGGVLLPIRAR